MKRSIKFNYKTEQQMFRAYIELLQPILKLRDRECDVFSQLLFFNYLKKDIKDPKDRFELIFSTKSKKQIIDNLGIKDSILQNTLSILRKKNLIIDNMIPDKFHIYPTNNNIELTFKLEIKNNN